MAWKETGKDAPVGREAVADGRGGHAARRRDEGGASGRDDALHITTHLFKPHTHFISPCPRPRLAQAFPAARRRFP